MNYVDSLKIMTGHIWILQETISFQRLFLVAIQQICVSALIIIIFFLWR